MAGLAVIDGDIVSYRCAAANEKRSVIATHKDTLSELEFDTATQFKEWVSGKGYEYDWFTLTPKQTPAPIEHALNSVKTVIHNITEKAKCDSYHIVVSGKDNFRLDLPLPTRYKGNRAESTRPLQLDECREYLLKYHDAEVSEGVEADDVLVGYMYQGHKDGDYVVQCSLDKDAKCGPGWLFDWTTMSEPELIEGYGELTCTLRETGRKTAKGAPVYDKIIKGKGRAWLWYQLVYGDAVDGFKPCELAKAKFGEVGAYDLLKHATSDKEALEAIVTKYKLWYPEPITYRAWDDSLHTKDWLEIMQMYADCCFMRRWEGDRLDVKKLLTKLKVNH
jgi:hypothetical protein